MSCAAYNESLNALLDGELPPEQAATLTAHLAACPGCTQTLAELAELRAGLAQALPEVVTPELQARIEALLADEGAEIIPLPPRRRLPGWSGWIAATALAAALMFSFLPHHDETKDLMSVRDAALRGAVGGVETAALAVPGYQLTGSHMDLVAGHLAQVAVYTRDGQSITLCIWPANGEPAHGVKQAQYRGMSIDYWNDGRTEYWAAGTGAALPGFVAAAATAS